MLVLGLGGAILTLESGDVSVSITGMSLAAIVGIILNLFLPKNQEINKEEKTTKINKPKNKKQTNKKK